MISFEWAYPFFLLRFIENQEPLVFTYGYIYMLGYRLR